jgi:poly(A) polymerase
MLFKLIQKVITIFKPKKNLPHNAHQVKIPYSIDRSLFSSAALKVIERLKQNGYEAYFVGGCIRDILLGQQPKDFDVVTNARPDQIIRVFSNAIVIGRRFTLVHVRFRQEIVEVATFRRDHRQDHDLTKNGIIMDDNRYGTLEDDVLRRDFTVNALYYDPIQKIMIRSWHINYSNYHRDKNNKSKIVDCMALKAKSLKHQARGCHSMRFEYESRTIMKFY